VSRPVSDNPFVTHRSLLFTVAYEMLGSAAAMRRALVSQPR